jgi:3'-phosphoadenosine 5'-phosphosulfate sulfotransferase (PAPS reductase)/FAD synthetase
VSDPFKVDGPAVISFSGGRTSGLMLYRILEAHGGTLPSDVLVVFCNTGKERPETLDFVERCSVNWGVPIVWLEYRYTGGAMQAPTGDGVKRKTPGKHSFTVVDYATASRNGEPFEQVIHARNMLPNVVARFCTVELKMRTQQRYLKSLGWKSGWTSCIGFRADEPQRVAKLRGTNRHNGEEAIAPLAMAKVMLADVMDFWKLQPFDLQLDQHEGNCDLCFLKGAGKIQRIMRARPDLADWWIQMETVIEGGVGGTDRFRLDRPRYLAQLELSQRPQLPGMEDGPDELSIACHCTD